LLSELCEDSTAAKYKAFDLHLIKVFKQENMDITLTTVDKDMYHVCKSMHMCVIPAVFSH